MSKTGIDTAHALRHVHKKTTLRLKPLGLKDAHAITRQYVCATSRSTKLKEYSDDTVSLLPVGYVQRPLSGKDMVGNMFEITVRDHDGTLSEFTEWKKILNFYAYQRFGSARAMTHLVGKALVTRDWRTATEIILKFSSPYESESTLELRAQITEAETYTEMLKIMPHGMDIERILAGALENRDKPLDALRTLPLQIRRLYVQAYQSYIFNSALSSAVESSESLEPQTGDVCYGANSILGRYTKPDDMLAMPLVGHSYYAKSRFAKIIRDILDIEGVSPRDFAVRDMQEIAAEGGFRTITMGATRTSIESDMVCVLLRRGAYATALMREVIKPKDPVAAGLAA